jgi:type III secretion protein J
VTRSSVSHALPGSPRTTRRGRGALGSHTPLAAVVAFTGLALAGCFSPVAAGLDEAEANRTVVALQASGIDARKEAETGADGHFRVMVSDSEAGRALVTLTEEGLPRPKSTSLAEAVGKNALVPSVAAEQAELSAGLAGELEKSLGQLDGVVVARVHLNLPPQSPLRDRDKKDRATASVLLSYRGTTPPLTEAQVKKLVSSSVPELAADDVTVIAVAKAAKSPSAMAELARVGPLGVAPGSATPLRLMLGALVLLVGFLAATALVLYLKVARLRGARE